MKTRLLILDRDGVINHPPESAQRYILDSREIQIYPDVSFLLHYCATQDIKVVVATNQQCVGLHLIDMDTLIGIHEHIGLMLGKGAQGILEAFYVCPHLASTCVCRKPQPGLLLKAMADFDVESSQTIYVGDQLIDAQAAEAADVLFIGLDRNHEGVFSNGIQAPSLYEIPRLIEGLAQHGE